MFACFCCCFVFSEVRRQLYEWTRLPCPRDNPSEAPLVTQKALLEREGDNGKAWLPGGCTGSPVGQQRFSLQHMQSPESHSSLRICVGHLIFPRADSNIILWSLWPRKKGQIYIVKPHVKKKLGNERTFIMTQVARQSISYETSHTLHIPSTAKSIQRMEKIKLI